MINSSMICKRQPQGSSVSAAPFVELTSHVAGPVVGLSDRFAGPVVGISDHFAVPVLVLSDHFAECSQLCLLGEKLLCPSIMCLVAVLLMLHTRPTELCGYF